MNDDNVLDRASDWFRVPQQDLEWKKLTSL